MFYISEDPKPPFVRVRDGYLVQDFLLPFFPLTVYTLRGEKIDIEKHEQGWYTITVDDTYQKRYVLSQYVLRAVGELSYTFPIIAIKTQRDEYDSSHILQLPHCWTFQTYENDARTFLVGRVTASEYTRLQETGWSLQQAALVTTNERWICTYGIAHELLVAEGKTYRAPLSLYHVLKYWKIIYPPQSYLWR